MKTIALPTFSGWVDTPFTSIVRLEGARNYTAFVLNDGQRLIFSKTISVFEAQLPFPFIRISKSCIINLDYLSASWRTGRKEFLRADGITMAISRRRRQEVRHWITEWRNLR